MNLLVEVILCCHFKILQAYSTSYKYGIWPSHKTKVLQTKNKIASNGITKIKNHLIDLVYFFQDEQDVRTCIVHFVMSFLLAGDNGVIRKLVEQKSEYLAFTVQKFTLMSSEIS